METRYSPCLRRIKKLNFGYRFKSSAAGLGYHGGAGLFGGSRSHDGANDLGKIIGDPLCNGSLAQLSDSLARMRSFIFR